MSGELQTIQNNNLYDAGYDELKGRGFAAINEALAYSGDTLVQARDYVTRAVAPQAKITLLSTGDPYGRLNEMASVGLSHVT
jgi:hypothetical protein